jgi:hypothetical protein
VIYPNPTNGQFQIQLMGDYQIIIHDAAGRIVFTQNATDDTNINLTAERRSLYGRSDQRQSVLFPTTGYSVNKKSFSRIKRPANSGRFLYALIFLRGSKLLRTFS